MKIKGKKLEGPNKDFVVIPRDSGDIVLVVQAVLDYTEFDEICKAPSPPMVTRPGKQPVPDYENKKYVESLEDHGLKRIHWLVLKSLDLPENEIEWETIDFTDPETWGNYQKELREGGISEIEQGRIVSGVMSVNNLDDKKIDQARERFLASQRVAAEATSGQLDAQ